MRGHYRTHLYDGVEKSDRLDNGLQLGDLKPRSTVEVEIWATGQYFRPEMIVSYDTGARSVAIAERAYGLTGSFGQGCSCMGCISFNGDNPICLAWYVADSRMVQPW